MQQIVTIDAQGPQGELTETLVIEKLIGPSDLLAVIIDQMVGTGAGRSGSRIHQRDGHNDWARSIQARKSEAVAPAMAKLLGSCPVGRATMRASIPALSRSWASTREACWPAWFTS